MGSFSSNNLDFILLTCNHIFEHPQDFPPSSISIHIILLQNIATTSIVFNRFRSPLLSISPLIWPLVTKMFQFTKIYITKFFSRDFNFNNTIYIEVLIFFYLRYFSVFRYSWNGLLHSIIYYLKNIFRKNASLRFFNYSYFK